MAFENVQGRVPGLVASGNLATSQYLFVVVDSNGEAAVNTAAGAPVDGVLLNKPAARYRPAEVAGLNGVNVCKVVTGAGVTKGARVQSDSAGKAIDTASAKYSVGVALEGSTAADVLISVLLIPYGLEA